jgi:hypothetical protein
MNSTVRSLLISSALIGGAVVTGAVAFAQDGSGGPTTEAPSTEVPTTEAPAPDAPVPDASAPDDQGEHCEHGHRGERREEFDQAMAQQLGISVDDLRAAREAAHQAVVAELGEMPWPESRPDTQEERDAIRQQLEQRKQLFDQKLAEQLGISVDDLKAARVAVAEARIAERVANGDLTQEQADRLLEAIRNGEEPPFGPGRGGFGHHGPGGLRHWFGGGR